jgi:hypothetical protein
MPRPLGSSALYSLENEVSAVAEAAKAFGDIGNSHVGKSTFDYGQEVVDPHFFYAIPSHDTWVFVRLAASTLRSIGSRALSDE